MIPPERRISVIAHRGSSGSAPENTMAAFHAAVDAQADMIELDVRLSLDGALVVIHDQRVNRTTNGRGRVREKMLDQLKLLDAGAWYSARFRGERIPTLDEVLASLPSRVGLNIEVKTDGDRLRMGMMTHALRRLVGHHRGEREILVSSFDHGFLAGFHAVAPTIPTGALTHTVRDVGKGPVRIARRARAELIICSRAQLRAQTVIDAHQSRLRVFVYGVNSSRHLTSVMRAGVDGVITNFPGRMRNRLP